MDLKNRFKVLASFLFNYHELPRFLLNFPLSNGHSKLLIFTYHRISASIKESRYMAIPRDIFEQHIKFIKGNFKVVSLAKGLEAIHQERSRKLYAAINFDDGYMDNYLNAYPVLRKYQLPATIFLTTDFIGKSQIFWWDRVFDIVSFFESNKMRLHFRDRVFDFRRNDISLKHHAVYFINRALIRETESKIKQAIKQWEQSYPFIKKTQPIPMLTWHQIKKMDSSIINFGSHTQTHRNLCLLNDEEINNELRGSKKIIEDKLARSVVNFAYPFGMFDERIKRLVQECGFDYARTDIEGINSRDIDRYGLACINPDSGIRICLFKASICKNLIKSYRK